MYNFRFAPSPTGLLQVANLRAALFNWVLSKKYKGKFFLRIEDTDKERSKKEYIENILWTLKWMNLSVDSFNNSSFLLQSEHLSFYSSYARSLVPKWAFYCQCQEKIIEDGIKRCECREKNYSYGSIRFKVPNGQLSYKDLIFGDLHTDLKEIEDFVILRANGDPLFNFSVVLDDNKMNITHVVRGEDHKTNTFKHMLIYNAFNWKMPQWAHLPIIKGSSGKKLSKRDGDTSIYHLYKSGIPMEALFNFISRLGWGHKNEEIFSREKLIEIFDFHGIKKHSCTFEMNKLNFLSSYYIKNKDCKNETLEFLESIGKVNLSHFHFFYDEICKRVKNFLQWKEIAPFIWVDFKNPYINWKDITLDNIKNYQEEIRYYFTGNKSGLPIDLINTYFKDQIKQKILY